MLKPERASREVRACFCVGPQNGALLCPCRQRAQAGLNTEMFAAMLKMMKPRIRVKAESRKLYHV